MPPPPRPLPPAAQRAPAGEGVSPGADVEVDHHTPGPRKSVQEHVDDIEDRVAEKNSPAKGEKQPRVEPGSAELQDQPFSPSLVDTPAPKSAAKSAAGESGDLAAADGPVPQQDTMDTPAKKEKHHFSPLHRHNKDGAPEGEKTQNGGENPAGAAGGRPDGDPLSPEKKHHHMPHLHMPHRGGQPSAPVAQSGERLLPASGRSGSPGGASVSTLSDQYEDLRDILEPQPEQLLSEAQKMEICLWLMRASSDLENLRIVYCRGRRLLQMKEDELCYTKVLLADSAYTLLENPEEVMTRNNW